MTDEQKALAALLLALAGLGTGLVFMVKAEFWESKWWWASVGCNLGACVLGGAAAVDAYMDQRQPQP